MQTPEQAIDAPTSIGADVVMRRDHEMRVAALLDVPDLADIRDYSGEHGSHYLGRGGEAFQHVGAKGLYSNTLKTRRFVKAQGRQRIDGRPPRAAEDDPGSENLQPVRQAAIQKRGMDAGAAFDQKPGNAAIREVFQHAASTSGRPRTSRCDLGDLDAAG